MPRFALSCLASLVFIVNLSSIPSLPVIGFCLLALSVAYVYHAGLRSVIGGCLCAVLMLSASLLELSSRQLELSEVGVDTRLVVQVNSVPQRDARRLRFDAIVLNCLSCEPTFGPKRLQLSWYGGAGDLQAGDRWELTARLKPVMGLRNPGGFDQVRWSIASGLHARGYVRDEPAAILLERASFGDIAALRGRLSESLAVLASADSQLGLVQALTLGVRHRVSDHVWDLLRQTGTSHLLAISGLHITLLAGWGYLLSRAALGALLARSRWLRLRCPEWDPSSFGLWVSLSVALLYALLAGFGLPTQRAVIMLAVWVLASWRFRVLGTLTAMSVALVAVLIHNPLSVLSVGFWLSFGTVAALFYLHKGRLQGHQVAAMHGEDQAIDQGGMVQRLSQWLSQRLPLAIQMHVLLGLLLLPVTAWYFQNGSLVSPLANLFAVPWVGVVVVPLCFLALLSSQLSPWLGDYFLQGAQWSIAGLLSVLQWLVDSLAGSIVLVMPSAAAAACCLFGLLLLMAPRGLGLRWMAVPLVLPALLFNSGRQAMEGFETHVLDVGQGLAVLVFTEQQTLLFDTGGKVSSQLSMFEAVVMPFLQSKGRRRIDTLVVSHTDEDHSFGVSDVLERFPNVRLISSVPANKLPLSSEMRHQDQMPTVERCQVGMHWQSDDTVFSVVHPALSDHGTDNDLSCVLLIHHGASRVVLTGDIEASSEKRLLSRLEQVQKRRGLFGEVSLPVDLLVAPHHGSKTSSTQKFVDALHPQYVVFAAGYGNRYGFPHVDVQFRYELLGAMPYITGTEGAVSFSFARSGVDQAPSTWWHSYRSFWHGIVNTACSDLFSEQSLALRLAALAHKGQTLCGK